MAPTTPDPDTPGGQDPNVPGAGRSAARDPDVIDAAEFAARVGFARERTVTDLCNAGHVRGATKVGNQWRIHFATFWAELCGRPGVPYGEILTAAQLAARIGIHEKTARRMLASGQAPGLQLGGKNGTWLCALPAVWMRFGWSLDAAVPQPPAAASRPVRKRGEAGKGLLRAPAPDGAARAHDVTAADVPSPPAVRSPGAARAGTSKASRRRAQPGSTPGRSAPAR